MNRWRPIVWFFRRIGLRNTFRLFRFEFRRRVTSREVHIGFHYDLCAKIETRKPPVPLILRPVCPEDIPRLFGCISPDVTVAEIRERLERLCFLCADIPACFVASGPGRFPYALCWLITPAQNKMLQAYFKGNLQPLGPEDVLLEFVYVHPHHRGKGLMEWISKMLFEKARRDGYHRAVSYVRGTNEISLASSHSMGWRPFCKKHIRWKLFKRSIRVKPVEEEPYRA